MDHNEIGRYLDEPRDIKGRTQAEHDALASSEHPSAFEPVKCETDLERYAWDSVLLLRLAADRALTDDEHAAITEFRRVCESKLVEQTLTRVFEKHGFRNPALWKVLSGMGLSDAQASNGIKGE